MNVKRLTDLLSATAIVIVSFLTSKWLVYDFLSISYFAPMEKASDFRISDFYNIVADGREVRTLDSQIVVVNIDGCSRDMIADVVEQIDFCAPKAIGLDVLFDYPGPDDSHLLSVLSECENLVLPVSVIYDSGKVTGLAGSFFYDSLPKDRYYGAVNLAGSDARSVIREFRPFFIESKDTIFNFSVQLARMTESKTAGYLLARKDSLETIFYPSREFEIIDAADVLRSQDLLRDKTVLVGAINDFSDKHETPAVADMPGILVHANTLATILHKDYIRKSGKAIDWSIAFILCFLVVFTNLKLRPFDSGAMLVRILQMLMLYFIVMIGCKLFINNHIYIDFSYPLMMVGTGLVTTDMLLGLFSFGKFIYERPKKIYLRHKITKNEKTDSDIDI